MPDVPADVPEQPAGRGAVEELPDGPHRTGISVGNQKARRNRLNAAQLAALAELGINWAAR